MWPYLNGPPWVRLKSTYYAIDYSDNLRGSSASYNDVEESPHVEGAVLRDAGRKEIGAHRPNLRAIGSRAARHWHSIAAFLRRSSNRVCNPLRRAIHFRSWPNYR